MAVWHPYPGSDREQHSDALSERRQRNQVHEPALDIREIIQWCLEVEDFSNSNPHFRTRQMDCLSLSSRKSSLIGELNRMVSGRQCDFPSPRYFGATYS